MFSGLTCGYLWQGIPISMHVASSSNWNALGQRICRTKLAQRTCFGLFCVFLANMVRNCPLCGSKKIPPNSLQIPARFRSPKLKNTDELLCVCTGRRILSYMGKFRTLVSPPPPSLLLSYSMIIEIGAGSIPVDLLPKVWGKLGCLLASHDRAS